MFTPKSKDTKGIKDLSPSQLATFFSGIESAVAGGTSVREACKDASAEYGMNEGTLRAKFKRMKKSGGRSHGNLIFCAEDEEVFVGLLQGFSFANRALSREAFTQVVVKHRGGSTDWDTDAWYTKFLNRHKDRLRPGTVKGLKSERIRTTVHDQVRSG